MLKWFIRIVGTLVALLVATVVVIALLAANWLSNIASDLPKHSKIASTARGPVEYAEYGSGPPVLLFHGTPGGYDQALGVLKASHAEQTGLHYIIPSRPGYLRTPLSVGSTPAEQAAAMAALLDRLQIRRVAVIGTSGGGPSALQFALLYPGRCSALVLQEAVTRRHTDVAGPVLSPVWSFVRDAQIYLFSGQIVRGMQAKAPSDKEVTPIAQAMTRSLIPFNLRQAGQHNDLAQEERMGIWPLHRITCPTLILHGTADTNVPLADSQYAHREIQGSTLVTLAGEDHMMVITRYREIDEKIVAFLRAHR
jgi:pimeloyl-ACP methyl ester carboxylesterase